VPAAAALALIGAIAGASCDRELQSSIPITEVQVNDNRAAAGVERDAVLNLQLMIAVGTWRAEMALPFDRVLAFAEAGRPLMTPGPLIRVREGTTVAVSIDNKFGDDIVVHGLHDRPGPPVPLRVPANATAVVRFRPGPAGTYYYWGTRGETLEERGDADSLLTGALIVDAPDARTDDRVFVIGHNKAVAPPSLDAWLINGRSWPDTERMTYKVGEPIRWRWINADGSRHPMHLHGHYFRVISAGDNSADAARAVDRAPLVVTELLEPGATMAMEWSPERSGNWLFHCHTLIHTMPDNRLPMPKWFEEYAALPHEQHMAGMVLGVQAEGGPSVAAAGVGATPRRITLRVGERAGVRYDMFGVQVPGLGYGLEDGPITAPGPALTLERGRPVEITILNRLAHATTVHWHGIELDSYYDGVPHFGGDSRTRTPFIEPGGQFMARFTPPRAGTFIYHAHFNDYAQISTGLYGALVVLDPGRTLDPHLDHTFVMSRGGPDDGLDPVLLNGAIELPQETWRAGVTHRVRIIGITPAGAGRVRLMRGEQSIIWRAVAKDGADLPAQVARERPADFLLGPGETYDFEIAPEPGELRLEVLFNRPAKQRASMRVMVK
jgi:FtsP/CotA-like multicopper oxidase with cupredoxin domain